MTGSFFISAMLFMALHFRYVCMKQKFENDQQLKADVSDRFCHAIRTPVTTICGIAEMFDDEQGNLNSEQRELVRRLGSSCAALRALLAEGGASDIKSKVIDDRGVYGRALKFILNRGHNLA